MALSLRGTRAAEPSDGLIAYKVMPDLWHPQSNPDGYVSLGIAENTLMHDKLARHIHENLHLPNESFTYGDGPSGSKRLKTAVARFLTHHLKSVEEIQSSHVTLTNGCSSAVEHMAWATSNPGDGILLGQPYYGTFIADLTSRTGARVVPVTFGDIDPFSTDAVQRYEEALVNAERVGQRVTAMVLCNPHNPLGRCYPKSTLIATMRFCASHSIHLISDEIYALSVFRAAETKKNAEPGFTSCLSIPTQDIIPPGYLHVIWGTSKDFGANGIRLGAIISRNPELHNAIIAVGLYSYPSSLTEHVVANILEDDAWLEGYIAENQTLLGRNYQSARQWADQHSIETSPPANAGFFLWVNLGKYHAVQHGGHVSWANDEKIMDNLLNAKVFLASGKQFGSEKPGWFRIVFSHQQTLLEEGLSRIIQALTVSITLAVRSEVV